MAVRSENKERADAAHLAMPGLFRGLHTLFRPSQAAVGSKNGSTSHLNEQLRAIRIRIRVPSSPSHTGILPFKFPYGFPILEPFVRETCTVGHVALSSTLYILKCGLLIFCLESTFVWPPHLLSQVHSCGLLICCLEYIRVASSFATCIYAVKHKINISNTS